MKVCQLDESWVMIELDVNEMNFQFISTDTWVKPMCYLSIIKISFFFALRKCIYNSISQFQNSLNYKVRSNCNNSIAMKNYYNLMKKIDEINFLNS